MRAALNLVLGHSMGLGRRGLTNIPLGLWQGLGLAFVIAQQVLRTLANSLKEFGKRVTVLCSGNSLWELTLAKIQWVALVLVLPTFLG